MDLLLQHAQVWKAEDKKSCTLRDDMMMSLTDNGLMNFANDAFYHSTLGRINVNIFNTYCTFLVSAATQVFAMYTALKVNSLTSGASGYSDAMAFAIVTSMCLSIIMLVTAFQKILLERMGGSLDITEQNRYEKKIQELAMINESLKKRIQ